MPLHGGVCALRPDGHLFSCDFRNYPGSLERMAVVSSGHLAGNNEQPSAALAACAVRARINGTRPCRGGCFAAHGGDARHCGFRHGWTARAGGERAVAGADVAGAERARESHVWRVAVDERDAEFRAAVVRFVLAVHAVAFPRMGLGVG